MAFFQTCQSLMGIGIGFFVTHCVLLCWQGVNGEIAVTDLNSNETAAIFPDMQGSFGGDFPEKGLKGRVVFAQPKTACGTAIKGAPKKFDDYVWIVLIERGECPFVEKVLNAQKANFSSAIVFNTPGDQGLTKMGGSNDKDITIPSTFVGFNSGMDLRAQYSYPRFKDFVVHIREDEEVDLKMYLLPFAVVVGVCFFMIMIFFIIKFVRDYRRSRVARLSKKHLRKIPIRKFKKGQYYDTCAICLDEYEDGEKIRVLPCEHAYHAKCIDPWLTRNKKTCPVCKRRVIPGKDPNSDSDSDSEDGGGGASQTTPLLLNNTTAQRTHGSMNQVDGDSGPTPRARSAPPLFEATVVLETEGAVGGVGITTMSDGASSSTSHGTAKRRMGEMDSDRGEQREGRRKRRERKEAEERLMLGTEDDEEEEERRKAEKKERRRKKKEKKKKSKKNSGGVVGEGSRGGEEEELLVCPDLETVDEVVVLNTGVVDDGGSSSGVVGGGHGRGYPRRGDIGSDGIEPITNEDDYGSGRSRIDGHGRGSGHASSSGGVANSGFSDSQEEVVVPSTRRGGKRELSEVV